MSVIIKTFCHFILAVTLLLSILFLLRGHNHPGGGFIGALIACSGIGFYNLAYENPPDFVKNKQVFLIIAGAGCLLISLLTPLLFQESVLTGLWWKINADKYEFKLGTPLLFDIGIYLSILGSLVGIMTYLENETHD